MPDGRTSVNDSATSRGGDRRRDDAGILDVGDAEPIVIKLRYYGNDAWRLESAIHEFTSGSGSWIVRRKV